MAAEAGLGRLKARAGDLGRHAWVVLHEATAGFFRNGGLRQASALAFYTALALIPTLLLLTFVLGLGIGSSQKAMAKTAEFVGDVIPRFGDVVLREVGAVARNRRGAGTLNLLVLAWALTPLVAALRGILADIFKLQARRAFWIVKALDLFSALVFITGLALVAGSGVFLKFLRTEIGFVAPAGLRFFLPFLLTVALVWGLYAAFTSKVRPWHLLGGALTTAVLWFLLRPAFTLFLTFHHGYGLAFGSFKSIFIVIIWIYYSQAVLLFGAEVAAALHREETVLIRRLMVGKRGLPLLGRKRFVMELPAGGLFFREGDPGGEMYHLLRGSVSVRKGEREIAEIAAGSFFGEMSFLLGAERSATALALEPCECIVINGQNLDALMREYPELIREMLTELARRLKATSSELG